MGSSSGLLAGAEAVGVHGDERRRRRGPDAAVRGGVAAVRGRRRAPVGATMGRRWGPASVGAAAAGCGRRPTIRAAAGGGRRPTIRAAARGGRGTTVRAAAVRRGATAAGGGRRRRGAGAAVGRGRQRPAVRRRWPVPAAAVGRRRPGGA